MSFMSYLESKKRPAVTVSLDHYRETVERAVYDTLLDPDKRLPFVLSHFAEAFDLGRNLQTIGYPRTEELLLALATRDPVKIKRAHEVFSAWARGNKADDIHRVDDSLFECRSYLHARNVDFSKDTADRIVRSVLDESQQNATRIARLLERAINNVEWHNSTVILKVLKPDDGLVSSEGMVIVGQPPAMTFMCRQTPIKLEVYDIQDIEGYPISVQEDYSVLVRSVQSIKPLTEFVTLYAVSHPKERHKFDRIKRELALGIEATLPVGVFLEESLPDVPNMDVWRIKLKRHKNTDINETPIRWLDLIRKD